MILSAPRVHTGLETLSPGWVDIEDGTIRGVGFGEAPRGATAIDGLITPGLIDMHCHGGGGAAFTDGQEAAQVVLEAHLGHGTTSMMASLVTDSVDELLVQTTALTQMVARDELLGVHLEGPWISPQQCGAHDPDRLLEPLRADVSRLCVPPVRMVTFAPELPGALDAIGLCVRRGIVAAIGHTNANTVHAQEGLEAGATIATHLFNAMRPIHHRDPGPVWVCLRDASFVELIADGIHLHPMVLHDVMTTHPEQAVLITDAMAAAACQDGLYRLGPMQVTVAGGRATISGTDRIAGSSLTMDAALRYAVNVAGVPEELAVRAATVNPAAALGLSDRGRLHPGCRADLVIFNDALEVQAVMRAGEWV